MTTKEILKTVFEAEFELNDDGKFILTDKELRLIILENPRLGIDILEGNYPRADYQLTLLEDGFRIDFGYGQFKKIEIQDILILVILERHGAYVKTILR